MRRGHLSEYFSGVAVKKLSAVETNPTASNQHEFNGSSPLRALFGDEDRKNIPAKFLWIGHEQESVPALEGTISWYDARRQHPTRTEYRLYYQSNQITDMMETGDAFFLAVRKDGDGLVIITPSDSTMHNQLVWLFGIESDAQLQFNYQQVGGNNDAELDFAARIILEAIGIDPDEPEANWLDSLIEPFGTKFPKTRVLSELARSSLRLNSVADDPDDALLRWIEREEQLFKRLERRILAERIASGFMAPDGADVDGFIKFSLSVQNTRKSRAGLALENHLENLFDMFGIRFQRGAETENRNKPDFLFPGKLEYQDVSFPDSALTMLGSKSTLKDRWRQVLSEAARIETKHLATLEPGISENQTNEMRQKKLQLVVPRGLHKTYKDSQKSWLYDLADFIKLVRAKDGQR